MKRRMTSFIVKICSIAVLAQVVLLTAVAKSPESSINLETLRTHEIDVRIDGAKNAEEMLAALQTGWENPPATYRPHTRWWWPGNAVTKEGIDSQLQEMKNKGLGGVEIMSFVRVYTKGDIDFNSDEFVQMTKYVVDKARELGMEVTPALSPGWNHGHALVPEEDGSKAMVISGADIDGGAVDRTVPLPAKEQILGLEWGGYMQIRKKQLDALVAVALSPEGVPYPARRVDLTSSVTGDRSFAVNPELTVTADLPAGRWRLMAFWTCYTDQKCAAEDSSPKSRIVDHLNKTAVEKYLKNAGTRFAEAMGGDFGQTIDSFFGDSFEINQNFSYWSTGLYERFEQEKGYDLRPYLPMLLYNGAPETPYVRYDFGSFLSEIGIESMVRPLAEYAAANNVGMRQQPHYRFVSDIIEQSGIYQRPDTENTKRSFDPVLWHKLTTSGAWLYPSTEKKWVSCEAFTFINTRYRTSMEEMKRGTDLFLRDGVTQFYNHGYFYTPEKEIAPSRDLIWANRISPVNTWWPWYRGLADYQARASFLARQGRPECDVLVYAPYPTLWSEQTDYPAKHVRDLPFNPLLKTLVSNGYDLDCVNDDLLLNYAQIQDGKITINDFDYSVLILPRVITLSPEVLEKIAAFVKSGGTVMALQTLPGRSEGLMNHEANDAKLTGLRDALFNGRGGAKDVGQGKTWFFPGVDGFEYLTSFSGLLSGSSVPWSETAPLSRAQAEFIQALRSRLIPDFEIADSPQSNGLTFRRTKIGAVECWFICNLQPNLRRTEVTLKTDGGIPQLWNAMTGEITAPDSWRYAADGRLVVSLLMMPWDSIFVLVAPGTADAPAAPAEDASHVVTLVVDGPWHVDFNGLGGMNGTETMATLVDWTALAPYGDFSGTATYEVELSVPETAANAESCMLDLGSVHEVASVRVNGQEAGKVWMQPCRVELAGLLRSGRNTLEITVANLLWNYAAGLKAPTPVPSELQAHYGENISYRDWENFQRQKKRRSRTSSGLLGPITLTSGGAKAVEDALNDAPEPESIGDTTTYYDDFSGLAADPLDGASPEFCAGSETWEAHGNFKADGSFTMVVANSTACLPVTIQAGKTYTLSLDVTVDSAGHRTHWGGMAFADSAVPNLGVSPLGRAGHAAATLALTEHGHIRAYHTSATKVADVAGFGDTETLKMVLTTHAGTTPWTVDYYQEDKLLATHTFAMNPVITRICMGAGGGSAVAGRFNNIALTVSP